jgi:hypothetical protein
MNISNASRYSCNRVKTPRVVVFEFDHGQTENAFFGYFEKNYNQDKVDNDLNQLVFCSESGGTEWNAS